MNESEGVLDRDRKFDHPQVAFFHVFFRTAAIFTYVFCTWFSANFVMIFIVCVMLLALDFWTVKNVSGRLLVGLRWWNEIMPDGSSEWRFECADVRGPPPPTARLRAARARPLGRRARPRTAPDRPRPRRALVPARAARGRRRNGGSTRWTAPSSGSASSCLPACGCSLH